MRFCVGCGMWEGVGVWLVVYIGLCVWVVERVCYRRKGEESGGFDGEGDGDSCVAIFFLHFSYVY